MSVGDNDSSSRISNCRAHHCSKWPSSAGRSQMGVLASSCRISGPGCALVMRGRRLNASISAAIRPPSIGGKIPPHILTTGEDFIESSHEKCRSGFYEAAGTHRIGLQGKSLRQQHELNEFFAAGNFIPEHCGADGSKLPNQAELQSLYQTFAEMGIAHYFVPSFCILAR